MNCVETNLLDVNFEVIFYNLINDILAVFTSTFWNVHETQIFSSCIVLKSDEVLLGFFQCGFKLLVLDLELPCMSEVTLTTLQFTEGLISVMTPLLWFVPWLKKALPPHSFSQIGSRSLEQ